MMIPMILGRRKRDLTSSGLGFLDHDETMIKKLIPGNKIFDNSQKRRNEDKIQKKKKKIGTTFEIYKNEISKLLMFKNVGGVHDKSVQF